MKARFARTRLSLLTLAALMLVRFQLPAAAPSNDPLSDAFFSPEVLQEARSDVALTDTQREWLQREMEKVGSRLRELQARLQQEVEALGKLSQVEPPDEGSILAQLDRLLDAERAMKRLQVSLLISIKNHLTPEQLAKLRTWRKSHPANPLADPAFRAELQSRLEGKIRRIQAELERWQQSGRDPSAVATIMEEFDPLMKDSKHAAAEAVLDRALKELGLEPAPKDRR